MHIRVVAPGAAVNRDGVDTAAALITALGHRVSFSRHLFDRYRYLAGPLDARRNDLEEAFRDNTVDAVWFARGGTGAGELMVQLGDWFSSKPIVGYSDNCTLLVEAHRRGGVAIHGTVFEEAASLSAASPGLRPDAIAVLTLLESQSDAEATHSIALRHVGKGAVDNIAGAAMGGNLTTLCTLLGTPFAPTFDGCVVLLEDVGEPYYRLERMLVQLIQASALDHVHAVVLGDFVNCPRRNVEHSIEDIFFEHLSPRGVPVYSGAPIGHGEKNVPWRLGSHAVIQSGTLKI